MRPSSCALCRCTNSTSTPASQTPDFLNRAFRDRHKRRLPGATGAAFLTALVTLLGVGAAHAQRPLGVDVSSYQGGSINWTSVKGDGVVFAWAKATEGTGVIDADFVVNQNNGKAAGVYMGAYHFAHPNLNTPAAEANYFWAEAGPYILADGKTLMPMLDMEVFSGVVGASSYSEWANDWCADIVAKAAAAGVKITPAIYVSACNGCYFNTSVSQWYSDIADYNGQNVYTGTPWSTCTGCEEWGAGAWNFWQVSSSGAISGISGNVDLDGYNGTLAGLQSTMIATAAASALYYWDPQGTGGANPYLGNMSGTWEANDWSIAAAGQASPGGWVDGKAAVFGVHTGTNTPAFTVTLNSSHVVAGFFDGALTSNKACTIGINGPATITLASGAQGFDVKNGSDGSLALMGITNVIAGDGQAVPEGNGQLYFNGANTYSGGTQLGYSGNPFTGILNINNNSSLGTGQIDIYNAFGSAIVAEGTAPITIANAVSVDSTTNSINIVGNVAGLTFSGPWTLNGYLIIGSGASSSYLVTISGAISGSGAYFSKYNPGTLALSGNNTYTGPTAISGGPLLINGSGVLGGGAYSARITNNATLVYASTAAQTLSGVISGTGSLIQSNAGALTLTAANTYSGGTSAGGGATLAITADSALGSASAGLALNGACLKNNNSAPTLGASRTITLGANGGYFDAGWAPSNPITVNSKVTGAGRLLINLDGSPVVLANTSDDYSGDTIIGTNGPGYYSAGTQAWLKLGASGVIPNGSGKGNVFIYQAYDGMLDVAGFTQTINGLSGDGVVDNSSGSGSLTVGNNNQSSTFSGVIRNSAGSLALSKLGTGTLALGGANTYTGNTTVSGGTLALSGGSIGASVVYIGLGATLANTTTNAASIGGTTTFSSGSSASLTAVGGIPSAIGKISVGGDLTLGAPVFTINVSGAPLAVGTYRLMDCAGTLSSAANATPVISGIPLAAGYTASVATTAGAAGHVDLIVAATPAFSNLTPSQAIIYGTSSITLAGNVSAAGIFPAPGETVAVTINGNTQLTTTSDASGDFSIVYNTLGLPASGSAYPITYSYAGDVSLNPAMDSSTAVTVNQLPVVLAGTRPYDGTTNAAASILTVTNAVGTDVVNVASGTATLASAAVGAEPITSFASLTLGGGAAPNYTLVGASGSVTITSTGFMITSESVDNSGTNFVLTWQSTPGVTYQVVGDTNITDALTNWMNVGDPVLATNTTTSVTIPMNAPTEVFEVKGQ